MSRNTRISILVVLLVSVFATLAGLNLYQYGYSKQQEKFGERVRSYLLDNPKIIREMVRKLNVIEAREATDAKTKSLALYKDALERDGFSYVAGNPDGDVTIVEFFDYRCPYCKRSYPDMMKTVSDDGNVRLVLKEFPILGEDSVFATRAAIASKKQGKYMEFHEAMMTSRGSLNSDRVLQFAQDVGMDTEQLLKDMEAEQVSAEIKDTYQLANALGITGTPAFVIGGALASGAIPKDKMEEMVITAREKLKASDSN